MVRRFIGFRPGPTLVAALLVPGLTLGQGPALAASAVARSAGEEEYQVLRAYLGSPVAEKVDFSLFEKIGIFFIYNVDPQDPGNISGFFRQFAGTTLDPALVRQFVAVNRFPVPVDRRYFPREFKDSPQYLRKDVYSLSRVGFNARRDEALMYASFSSLLEDGHGALVLLKKTGGAWMVEKSAAVWIFGAAVHPFTPVGKVP